ncbi:MAG: RNA methyltransferase [Anaerolineaceae bacterium]
MTPLTEFVMLQCENESCRFRCPSNLSHRELDRCPICGSSISVFGAPFTNPEVPSLSEAKPVRPLEVLLDNLRSTLNVGSIFRTSDGAGVRKIHLCGTTPTPDHPKIAKTGLGAEIKIPWEYHRNGLDMVSHARSQGFEVVSLEAAPESRSIFSYTAASDPSLPPILLVIGNEITGIDPEILAVSDTILSIPMRGVKSSLNVAVAFGIAVYTLFTNTAILSKVSTR